MLPRSCGFGSSSSPWVFKTIEVGFPSASSHDFDFLRKLIEEERIPDDVTVQVLVQARAELITKTFEALRGVKKAVVHFYNSTSTVQRRDVFKLDRQGIIDIAGSGRQTRQSGGRPLSRHSMDL